MSFFAALLIVSHAQMPSPVLWVKPNGEVTINGRTVRPVVSPGTRMINSPQGVVYDFDGNRSGILLPNDRNLELTDSFTVSVWINARAYANPGNGAQIFFRGDDRNGVDPYTLVIHPDKTINFSVQGSDDRGFHVTGEMPLRRWVHVMASWEATTGRMMLWMNGDNVAFATTTVRPLAQLDRNWAPGLGIGNVQNDKGPHNQPFNGQLSDLRVYRGVWTPADLDFPRKADPPQNAAATVD